jgi:uncharacterized OsmC-like protein
MNKQKVVNGINIKRLSEIINVVKKNPELAKFKFRVKNTWMNGMHSRSIIKGFYGAEKEDDTRTSPFIFENDQPFALLGSNEGANSIEYILNGLAACLTNSIVYNAAAKEIIINDLESEVEGSFDLKYLFGFWNEKENLIDNIKVKFRIKGNNLSYEDKSFLCEVGKKSSPVFNILTNSFPVFVEIENEF